MAKRLSETQIAEMINCFSKGKTLDQLSAEFNITKLTVSRKLKKNLGEKKYNHFKNLNKEKEDSLLNNGSKTEDQLFEEKRDDYQKEMINKFDNVNKNKNSSNDEIIDSSSFIEIAPLDSEIDINSQKDLSSVAISDVVFPNVVYMIVDKKIELEIKFLKDYPEWQFLSNNELNRKTIEIFFDISTARRFCHKEQKVIKVPNTNVFKVVAPILRSRGITRIVTSDNLIAL